MCPFIKIKMDDMSERNDIDSTTKEKKNNYSKTVTLISLRSCDLTSPMHLCHADLALINRQQPINGPFENFCVSITGCSDSS